MEDIKKPCIGFARIELNDNSADHICIFKHQNNLNIDLYNIPASGCDFILSQILQASTKSLLL